MKPWPVIHRHLLDPAAVHAHERRQEAVHAVELGQPRHEIGAHHLEGAAGIGSAVVEDPATHAVGHLRRDPAHPAVVARGADADDHVEILEGGEKTGDVRRIVLQIRVEGHQHLTPGESEAVGQGGALPALARQPEHLDAGFLAGQLAQHVEGTVGARVVDEDDLVLVTTGGHGELDLARQNAQVLFLVVGGYDDGNAGPVHGWESSRR